MESKQRLKAVRWVALALVVGLALAWGGFSVAESAPASIFTCTKVSNNKTKVIATSAVAKCMYKAKGVAQTWDAHSVVVGLSGQLAAKDAQIAAMQTEEINFCTEYIAMRDYLMANNQWGFVFTYQAVRGAPALNALCFDNVAAKTPAP